MKRSVVDQAWEDEIERRIQAIDAGTAKGRTFTDVLQDLDKQLHNQTFSPDNLNESQVRRS